MPICNQCQGDGHDPQGGVCGACSGTGAILKVAPSVPFATKATRGVAVFVVCTVVLGWVPLSNYSFAQDWHGFALAAVPAAILAVVARMVVGLVAVAALAYLLLHGMFT